MNGNYLKAEKINMETPKLASMHEVVMKKDELIKALVENKAKHDAVFEAAVIGYWELAKEKLGQKKASLDSAISELKEDINYQIGKLEKNIDNKDSLPNTIYHQGFRWDSNLNLQFPENHTKDYERAIKMMESSVYDEVCLQENEFDAYVLNNWEWRNKFSVSNSAYLEKARGSSQFLATSGAVFDSNQLKTVTGAFYADSRVTVFNEIGKGSYKF